MNAAEQFQSAILQTLTASAIAIAVYACVWLFNRKELAGQSPLDYLGLHFSPSQLDFTFWKIWLALCIFAGATTWAQFEFSETFRQISKETTSPYANILRAGFDTTTILKAMIYCFIQASASEEILFRGLIARRLFNAVGHIKGNLIQALIFWIMHLLMFKMITGQWISMIQLMIFVTTMTLGLAFGAVNLRNGARSIFPSWLLHGSVNFVSFLTLAYLWV